MLTDLMRKLDFPAEAIEELNQRHRALQQMPELYEKMADAMDAFFLTKDKTFLKMLEGIATESGIPLYSVVMIFLLLAARPARYLYHQLNIPEDIYYDTLHDLTYKLMECKNVYNCWGTFVGFWYPNIYRCRIFKLGRLEYERCSFPHDSYGDFLKKGDPVLSCHIPSAGPLTPESVIESLKMAYDFFQEEKKDGLLPVYCSSWLLYPPHFDLFPENSNLLRFAKLFDVYRQDADATNHDFWRIFNIEYHPETLASAPEKTALQRNFKQYLLNGNCMGGGKGILLFDGEKICRLP